MSKLAKFSTAAVVAVASLAAMHPASAQSGHGMAHGTDMGAASSAYMEAMARMNEAMAAMKMSGEPGVDFALMMIPHHQSAIDMAKAYLASGESDPELAKLAADVIAAQESEIAFLRSWLQKKGK